MIYTSPVAHVTLTVDGGVSWGNPNLVGIGASDLEFVTRLILSLGSVPHLLRARGSAANAGGGREGLDERRRQPRTYACNVALQRRGCGRSSTARKLHETF